MVLPEPFNIRTRIGRTQKYRNTNSFQTITTLWTFYYFLVILVRLAQTGIDNDQECCARQFSMQREQWVIKQQ